MYLACTSRIPASYLADIGRIDTSHGRMDKAG
jgi:hypothetical protein